MNDELQELIALDAAGALDADEQRSLRERLAAATAEEQAIASQTYALAASLAVAGTHDAESGPSPRPAVRAALMERVSSPRTFSIFAATLDWLPSPLPGVSMKVLAHDHERDAAVLLIKAEAGARYPAHHHGKAEECYVISGELHVMGAVLHAGDFHHAEADSDHGELYTPTGVEVLLVVAASDYGL